MLCTCIKDGYDCLYCPLKRTFTECSLKQTSHYIRATRSYVECRNQSIGRNVRPPISLSFNSRYGITVRATTIIAKHTSIGRYTGDVVRNDGFLRTQGHTYRAQLTQDRVVDAAFGGSLMRYVNFSCKPNAKYELWKVGGQWTVSITAIQIILPGSEITTSNTDSTFSGACLCGEPSCKGRLALQATGNLVHAGDTPSSTTAVTPRSILRSRGAANGVRARRLDMDAAAAPRAIQRAAPSPAMTEEYVSTSQSASPLQAPTIPAHLEGRGITWGQEPYNDEILLFSRGWLSAFHMSDFTVNRIQFNCVEQYAMYHKAILFEDRRQADLILATTSPYEQHQLGKSIENYDEEVWTANNEMIMVRGTRHKFQQNPILLQRLLDTGTRVIGEATMYDRLWAIGRSMSDVLAWDRSQWVGSNRMGKAIMAVRTELAAARMREVHFAGQGSRERVNTIPWTTSTDRVYVRIRAALLSYLGDTINLDPDHFTEPNNSLLDIARGVNHHLLGTVSEELSHIATNPMQARTIIISSSTISEVSLFDLLTLRQGEMISGEVIDAFSSVLHLHFKHCAFSVTKPYATHIIFSTYFFTKLRECDHNTLTESGRRDYSAMDRWTRRFSIEVFDKLIIPINVSRVHWILATITKPHGHIEWHDSMNGNHEEYTAMLERWLNDINYRRYGITSWKYVHRKMETPLQDPGSNDCGIYVMAAMFGQVQNRQLRMTWPVRSAEPVQFPPPSLTTMVRDLIAWLLVRGGFGDESEQVDRARQVAQGEGEPEGSLPPRSL